MTTFEALFALSLLQFIAGSRISDVLQVKSTKSGNGPSARAVGSRARISARENNPYCPREVRSVICWVAKRYSMIIPLGHICLYRFFMRFSIVAIPSASVPIMQYSRSNFSFAKASFLGACIVPYVIK